MAVAGTHAGRFECEKCPRIQTAVTRYCLLISGIIAINAFLIWRLLAVGKAEWTQPEGQDYVEVLLAYLQLASMLVILDIQWPAQLGALYKFASAIVQLAPEFVSLDCLLQHHQSQLPLAVSRALVQIFLPFAILAFFCFTWLLAYLFMHRLRQSGDHDSAWLIKRCQISAFSVLGYFYPSTTQAALSVFSCYPIDASMPSDTPYQAFVTPRCKHLGLKELQYSPALATSGPGYWILDMDVACFKGWHRSLTLGLALPVLLLFSLGFPIAFAVVVGRKRKELQSASCKEQLGYAYRSHRDGCWWEQSAFQSKVLALLLVVVNGRPHGNYVQTLLFVGLLSLEFAYQVYVRPHRFPHVQHVREALVALLFFSVFTSFFFDDYEGQLPAKGLRALAAFIAAANVAFTFYVLYLICRTYLLEFIAYVISRVRARTRGHFAPVVELASARVPPTCMGT